MAARGKSVRGAAAAVTGRLNNPFDVLEVEETRAMVRVLDLSGASGFPVVVEERRAARGAATPLNFPQPAAEEEGEDTNETQEEEEEEEEQIPDTPEIPLTQGGRAVHCLGRAARELGNMAREGGLDVSDKLHLLRYNTMGEIHREHEREWKLRKNLKSGTRSVKLEQKKGKNSYVILALVNGPASAEGRALIVNVFQRRHVAAGNYVCTSDHIAALDTRDFEDQFDALVQRCHGM